MVEFFLAAYDSETGDEVNRWPLEDFARHDFNRMFPDAPYDPLFPDAVKDDPTPVLNKHRKVLESKIGLVIDLNAYDYFVEEVEDHFEAQLILAQLILSDVIKAVENRC